MPMQIQKSTGTHDGRSLALVAQAVTAFVLLAAFSGISALAAPAAGCPGIVRDAQTALTRTTNEATEGRATRIDVENAKIGLVEARYACEYIPRGMFCREKDWSLSNIVRILNKSVENGSAPQADLDAANERLRTHRTACPQPPSR